MLLLLWSYTSQSGHSARFATPNLTWYSPCKTPKSNMTWKSILREEGKRFSSSDMKEADPTIFGVGFATEAYTDRTDNLVHVNTIHIEGFHQ